MEGAISETPKIVDGHELYGSMLLQKELPTREVFEQASIDDLALVRESSRRLRKNKKKILEPEHVAKAEVLFKESRLELFFRIHGDEYRKEYNEWNEIKQKKQHEWEQKMLAKYGTEWNNQVTDEDHALLVYSSSEKEAYAKHKLIEAKAMKMKKKTINKFKNRGKKERGEKKEPDFFKLVILKTLELYPFLGEKEVKKAVNSFEFFWFYVKRLVRDTIRKNVGRSIQSVDPIVADQEKQNNLFESASFAKEIVMKMRERKINRPVSNVVSTTYQSTFFV